MRLVWIVLEDIGMLEGRFFMMVMSFGLCDLLVVSMWSIVLVFYVLDFVLCCVLCLVVLECVVYC